MKTVAIINRKGGVGKTTATINIGGALAAMGHRVLLADLDEQGDMTQALGVSMERGSKPKDMGAFLNATVAQAAKWALTEVAPNLWLIPSHENFGPELVDIQELDDYELLLRDRLAGLAGKVDYVLLDCPPSFGDGTAVMAFTAADAYVVPTDVEPSSVRGINVVMQHTSDFIAQSNRPLKFGGFVFSQFNLNQRGTLKKLLASDLLAGYGLESLLGCARQDSAIIESQNEGQPVSIYAPSSRAAQDFSDIATALLKRI